MQLPGIPLSHAHRRVATDRAQVPFEITHSCFPRVMADDDADRALVDLALLRCKTSPDELAFDQVTLGNLQFFLFGIAGKLDDLHAIPNRARDSVEHIGSRDEHHLREIESDPEIVVSKGGVLLGVEHFEKRRGWVAVETDAELVHLIEHHHRIASCGLAQRLDDVARHGADIGTAVTADLSLVMHPAKAQPRELATRGASNALPREVLPTPGGPRSTGSDFCLRD